MGNEEMDESEPELILALDASLTGYLGRLSIQSLIQQIAKSTIYIIFFNCSQFQKELCSASIFKIFPEHIFVSNFAIDENIFRMSNLSICIAGNSAAHLATATVSDYSKLKKFISV